MPTAKLTLIAMLVMSWCTVVFAQNKQFTGKSYQSATNSLAGVTVQIKNTKVDYRNRLMMAASLFQHRKIK